MEKRRVNFTSPPDADDPVGVLTCLGFSSQKFGAPLNVLGLSAEATLTEEARLTATRVASCLVVAHALGFVVEVATALKVALLVPVMPEEVSFEESPPLVGCYIRRPEWYGLDVHTAHEPVLDLACCFLASRLANRVFSVTLACQENFWFPEELLCRVCPRLGSQRSRTTADAWHALQSAYRTFLEERTVDLLRSHRQAIEKVTNALLERSYLHGSEVGDLIDSVLTPEAQPKADHADALHDQRPDAT